MSVTESPGDWPTRVRKRVRAVLAEHEIPAAEVARQAGWSQGYISHRLSPKAEYALSVADIQAIARVLGISANDLIPPDRDRVAA